MKAAAVKVLPEEEEGVWGSSEDWSSAALHKVSWYVRTFSPWKRADYWEQGVRMEDLAMWLQPWFCPVSLQRNEAWCALPGAAGQKGEKPNPADLDWVRDQRLLFLKKMLLWRSGVLASPLAVTCLQMAPRWDPLYLLEWFSINR